LANQTNQLTMNKSPIIFLILFLTVKLAIGQSLFAPGEGLQFTFTTGETQFKEYLFNGLNNNGIDLSFGLNYFRQEKTLNHEFGLNIDAAYLWNRYGWSNWYSQPNLHYRLLANTGKRLQLGSSIGYSSLFYYNENFDSHHDYWITTVNLGFSASYNQPINSKWTLIIPFNLPLVGFLSRPEADRRLILNEPDLKLTDILKRINSDFQFVTLGKKYFDIETGIFLRTRMISDRLVTIGYRARYTQTFTSLKTQLLTNQICIQYPLAKHQK
jgi:hypothetical protein